jgi:hypothetical protein
MWYAAKIEESLFNELQMRSSLPMPLILEMATQ